MLRLHWFTKNFWLTLRNYGKLLYLPKSKALYRKLWFIIEWNYGTKPKQWNLTKLYCLASGNKIVL